MSACEADSGKCKPDNCHHNIVPGRCLFAEGGEAQKCSVQHHLPAVMTLITQYSVALIRSFGSRRGLGIPNIPLQCSRPRVQLNQSSLPNRRERFEIILLPGASQMWSLMIQKRPLQRLISAIRGDG